MGGAGTVIFKGSRYQNVGVYQATDTSGRTVTALQPRFVPNTPAGFLQSITADTRLDLLAYQFYRQPREILADRRRQY